MSLINTSELGNMLIGAYVGELLDIHTKNESQLEVAQYPSVSGAYELNFATTSQFDVKHIRSLIPSSCQSLPAFIRENVDMSELAKTRIDFQQFTQFIQNFKETDTLDIYGIMINLGHESRINPLHPFVAQAIVSGAIQLPETFEVIVYPMQKEKKITQKGLEENVTAAVHLLNFINQNGQTAREVIKPKNSVYTDIRELLKSSNPLDFAVEFQSQESSSMMNVLTPIQYASDGVVTPYYGVVQSRFTNGSYSSQQCSPMLTGNLRSRSTDFDYTCTGDLSSTRYASLRVLNGFNLNSAYFDGTVSAASFHWIKACQLISIELLSSEPSDVEETQEKE